MSPVILFYILHKLVLPTHLLKSCHLVDSLYFYITLWSLHFLNKSPFFLCVIIFPIPPVRDATTGMPAENASSRTIPKGSCLDGRTSISASEYASVK